MRRLFAGVALVTFATLLLQLLLTRIFSYTIYYHFAFLVICLAMFGLGAAGVVLYVRSEEYPAERLDDLLARHARRFVGWTLVVLVYVLHHGVAAEIDVLVRPTFTWRAFFDVAMLCGVVAVPMYHSGMVVSLAITHLRSRIGELYAFDLGGAALACAAAGPLIEMLGPENSALLAAATAAAAAVVFVPRPAGGRFPVAAAVLPAIVLAALACNVAWPILRAAPFKQVVEPFVRFSKWNAFSRITVVEEPGRPPAIHIDGAARTEIRSAAEIGRPDPANALSSLVYQARRGGDVLVIGPGGGVDVVAALGAGADTVTGAEINPIVVEDVMLGAYRERSGNLYALPNVRIVVDEGRSFVRRSGRKYDVIQSTLVDTWAAGASDAFALTENGLYTVEAFVEFLEHLTPRGILSVTRWCIPPDMECIRVVTIAREALRRIGVEDARGHVFMASQAVQGTVLVRRTPFPPEEVEALAAACDRDGLSPTHTPGEFRGAFVAGLIRDPDPSAAIDSWSADISPVTDDRPFFFYGVKPRDFLAAIGNPGSLMANSLAVAVLLSVAAVVLVMTAAFIIVPMVVRRREALAGAIGRKLRDLGFFVSIGIGFIVIEIVMVQRFSLFLGHPSHSLAVVLFSLLLSSGVGAALSGRVGDGRLRALLACGSLGTAGLMVLYVLVLPAVLDAAFGWALWGRIGLSVALIAAPGLAMGTMLPTGVRLVSSRHPEIVPWGWGLNGAASVLGSVLAMVLAMNLGFRVAMATGAAAYLAALATGWSRRESAFTGGGGEGR